MEPEIYYLSIKDQSGRYNMVNSMPVGPALLYAPRPHRYNPSGAPSFFLYMTYSLAFLNSACETRMRRSRSASSPASVHMALMSAPESSSLLMMNSSRSTSELRFILPVWIWKMCRRVFWSGAGNSILRSIRPGRMSAGSSVSILFVARITFTSVRASKPSSWLSSSSIVRWISRSPPLCESYRFVPTASISSMKTIVGAFSSATRKSSRTSLGPSPRYFWMSSEPVTRRKVALVWLATALASSVLPVPGSP
mmetsp:Transcript_9168/g.18489  ORF Transcript_9168/g.18489 Transcript_9168/m.18489 type:complete len:252 (-) Transcript_9168:715-1470(-)